VFLCTCSTPTLAKVGNPEIFAQLRGFAASQDLETASQASEISSQIAVGLFKRVS
jgi:hypothetical protein